LFIQHLFKTPQQALWVWWFLFLRGFNTPQKKGAGFIEISLYSLYSLTKEEIWRFLIERIDRALFEKDLISFTPLRWERISDRMLAFHPFEYKNYVLEEYNKRLKLYEF